MRLDLKESREGFCWGGKGRSFHPCGGAEDRKGTGANNGKSGMRNMEAESIRIRAKSMEGYVKLKTVTEIRQSSAHGRFIAESLSCTKFFVGLGASGGLETEE